jgi:cytochrome c5
MSHAHAPHAHADEAHEVHEGPIKTPKQLAWAVLAAFVVPIIVIVLLAIYVVSATKPGAGADAFSEQAVAGRLQKVGSVEIRDASNPASLRTGEQVYAAQCAACHANGAAGAPKHGDADAWAARIKTGFAALLGSALKGKGAMAAQGGGDFSDFEIGRAVAYLANASGGSFPEPKQGEAAAAAPVAGVADAAPAAPKLAADGSGVLASDGLVKLFFASGKAALPGAAEAALARLAEQIKADGKSAVISGFHDSKGSPERNAELAKQRAFGVRDMLLGMGVAQDKLQLKKPENTTGSGDNAQARRVEVALQ